MNAHEPRIIRLLLVDRHDMVRTGLRQFFAARNIEIVGECDSLFDGVATALRLQPDVVLMEYQFPNGSSLQACREIRIGAAGRQKNRYRRKNTSCCRWWRPARPTRKSALRSDSATRPSRIT